jgi:septal ring-binding cell division protein DamX
MLRGGRFGPSASAFAGHLRGLAGTFTIQLLVACSDDTVKKAADSVPQDELYIVPVVLKGRSCYRIGWGIYDSDAKGTAALKSLPSYFHQPGVTPRVVPTSTVLP